MREVIILAGFVISIAVSAVIYGRNFFSHREQRIREETRESPPTATRNITCHVCGRSVAEIDYQMPCGHRCHRKCLGFSQQSGNVVCGFCDDSSREDNAPDVPTGAELRKRVHSAPDFGRPELNRQSTSQNASGASINNSSRCSYCCGLINQQEGYATLPCQHSAHFGCYADSHDRLQCQICSASGRLPLSRSTGKRQAGGTSESANTRKNNSSDECNRCDIPMRSGEDRVRLPCRHFVHKDCMNLKIIMCKMCRPSFESGM